MTEEFLVCKATVLKFLDCVQLGKVINIMFPSCSPQLAADSEHLPKQLPLLLLRNGTNSHKIALSNQI